MARRSRRQDIGEQHEQRRLEREAAAEILTQRYPGVSRIELRVEFDDPDRQSKPEPTTRVFEPTHRAFFELKCPFYECVLGGFSFSSIVSEAVRSRAQQAVGHLVCEGWQDRERIGKHRCMLKASYTLHVWYSEIN